MAPILFLSIAAHIMFPVLPDNGMHPAADTTLLKFLLRCGAGDTGR